MDACGADKVKMLDEATEGLKDVTFAKRPKDMTPKGYAGIYEGSPIGSGPAAGRSPVLVVMDDGTILTGLNVYSPNSGGYVLNPDILK